MEQWVPFAEGEYIVEAAFLITPQNAGLMVENAAIEVFSDSRGLRRVKGSGMVRPAMMVELHEEGEKMDLVIDLGEEFKYRMETPQLNAGKVFSPDIFSQLHFRPTRPWERISREAYRRILDQVDFL